VQVKKFTTSLKHGSELNLIEIDKVKDSVSQISSSGTSHSDTNAHEACHPSASSLRRAMSKGSTKRSGLTAQHFIPVVDQNQKPLMPTTPNRARRWIISKKATPFYKRGILCVRLNTEPSDRRLQEIVIGIDPGARQEGFTIKAHSRTFLNIQADAVTWVSESMTRRKMYRGFRRYRNCPHRATKSNRLPSKNWITPSSKARGQWKLRIVNWLRKMYPVSSYTVEIINGKVTRAALSKTKQGCEWLLSELNKLTENPVKSYFGYETKVLREEFGLNKIKDKFAHDFEDHCVDSWVLANSFFTNPQKKPDNRKVLRVVPIKFNRRMLFRMFKGEMVPYGGTRSFSLKRGSIVKHLHRHKGFGKLPGYGLCYVGGIKTWKDSKGIIQNRISLHSIETGIRITQEARIEDCKFLSFNSQRTFWSAPKIRPEKPKEERIIKRRNSTEKRSISSSKTANSRWAAIKS